MSTSRFTTNPRPLLVLCALAAGAHAQSVWVVDAGAGAGSHFTQISDAVGAASDGDVVLVRSGSYDGFTIDGLDVVVTADLTASVEITGTVTVRNLQAGQFVTLRRLDATSATGPGLLALDSSGRIWLEKCNFVGRDGAPGVLPSSGARVEACAGVTFVRCGSFGGSGFPTFGSAGQSGWSGIHVRDASVAVHESTAIGGTGQWGDDIGGFGGDGLLVEEGSSFVLAAGSTFHGGDGGGADDDYDLFSGLLSCGFCGSGGSGVQASTFGAATVLLLDNVYSPGDGGLSTSVKGCPDGSTGFPVMDFGGLVTLLQGQARGLRTPSPVREGESTALSFTGAAGDLVALLLAPEQGFLPFPAYGGILLTGPAPAILAMGSLPASGLLQIPITTPQLPDGVRAGTFYLQSLVVSPALQIVLGGGSQVTILDASL